MWALGRAGPADADCYNRSEVSPQREDLATSQPSEEPRGRPTSLPIGPADEAETTPSSAGSGEGARSVLELIGLVIAPTTLLTALAFFFGWTLTNARAQYFGIDPSALGFTTQDYLLRSADALFVPLGAIALVALAAVVAHTLAGERLREPEPRSTGWKVAVALCALGAGLLVLGIVAALRPLPFPVYYLVPPLAPGLGAGFAAYGVYLLRGQLASLAIGLVAFLVVLSAFWAAARYADALGRGRAADITESLASRPSVVVYSKERLQFGPPVAETELEAQDAAYAFRYEGLRLLVRSGGQYFLLPDGWSRGDGVAIVLRDSAELRFEFGVGP